MRLLLGVLIAGSLAVSGSAQESGSCQAICGGANLESFFAKLDAGARPGARPIHVLQIGDSHSAGDNISGAWRETLQGRYGNGGRGVMPPGKPFDGFTARGVTISQTPGWSVQSIFASATQHLTYGISGFRLTTTEAGEKLTMSADAPPFDFDRLVVCALYGPGAGAYTLKLGAVSAHVSLDATESRVGCVTMKTPGVQGFAELDVETGPVTLTSWASFADNGGVAVSNLGVVGTQLKNFGQTDDQAVSEELRAYQPDLIVLEFGTNEGFVPRFDPDDYERTLRGQIRRLQKLSNGTPILVFGAPDADTDRSDLAYNAVSAPDTSPPGPGNWQPPPAIAAVRAIQRRVAPTLGAAYWDWGPRMGGPATAQRWANQDPPLMRKDRVHYTVAGGQAVAALLQQDLDAAKAADILSVK